MTKELARIPKLGSVSEKLTGAEIVMRTLEDEMTIPGDLNLPVVIGYPGGASLPMNDRTTNRSGIRHILCRDERAGAFIADGYARAGDRVGVIMTTSGPGATNLATGLATAKMDSVPMVALTAQVSTSSIGFEAFQEVDVLSLFKPVTKSVVQVRRASDIQDAIREAFRKAKEGRPGPVGVDLPKNVQQEEAPFQSMEPDRVNYDYLTEEAEDRTDQLAILLDRAKRPLIFAGHGVILSGASRVLQALAEKTDTPVITSLHARGVVPTNHRLNRGSPGMHGNFQVNLGLSDADLVVLVGSRGDDRSAGKEDEFAPNAKVVHINIDPNERNRKVRADLMIQASAKPALQRLLEKTQPNTRNEWVQRLDELDLREDVQIRKPALSEQSEFITVPEGIQALNTLTNGEAIVVADVGQHQMFAMLHGKFNDPENFFSSGGLGAMGYAIPAAIGAALARPDKKVIAITGDGGARMNFEEVELLNELGLDVGIWVVDNGVLGMVRQWQELFYKGNYANSVLPFLDFAKLGRVYGVKGEVVRERERLLPAMKRLVSRGRPYIAQTIHASSESVYPMVTAGQPNYTCSLGPA